MFKYHFKDITKLKLCMCFSYFFNNLLSKILKETEVNRNSITTVTKTVRNVVKVYKKF